MALYHTLPAPLRDLAAGAHGLGLRRWRYGPETERQIEEALERDFWSPAALKIDQENRLEQVLHRAATRVPYYRQQWEARRRRGDRASWTHLENWPILDKEPLRANPRAFVADDCDVRQMYPEHTTGSSGSPLDVWWSRATVRHWYALLEARVRRWNGVSWKDPWANLGGKQVVPGRVTSPPFWVWNPAMHQLYLSSNHVNRRNAPAYVRAIQDYGITHMIVYSSSAALLGAEIEALGLPVLNLKLVATNAEPLFPWQRASIQHALSPNTRETYGMAEITAAASECEAGQLHLWPEVGLLEALDDAGDAVPKGQSGRLIGTGLLNDDMPLIRFVIGDRGQGVTAQTCPCGRTLPVLAPVEGKLNDLIVTPDGRHVFSVMPSLYGQPIRESQIIQETRTRIRLLYVPAPEFTEANARTIVERLQMRLGAVDIALERVDAIPRSAGGKLKAVDCRLSSEEIAQARAES